MRIPSTNQRSPVNRRKGAAGGGGNGGGFNAPDVSDTVATSSAHASKPLTAINALLSIQAVEDPMLAKKRAVKHASSMLDRLEEIKSDLLVGRVGESRLNQLMALVTRARQDADPELAALIEDIDLRARVELAKLGRY